MKGRSVTTLYNVQLEREEGKRRAAPAARAPRFFVKRHSLKGKPISGERRIQTLVEAVAVVEVVVA